MKKIRIVIADDSTFMRRLLKQCLEVEKDIEVVGLAENGREAVELVKKEKPDVLLLDIEMPVMSGLVALTYLMKNHPLPILIVSAYAADKVKYSILALEQGAVDLIEKPSGEISLDIEDIQEEIISKIRHSVGVEVHKVPLPVEKKTPAPLSSVFGDGARDFAIVIGSSTGGIAALELILSKLPKYFPCPIFIVQHLPQGFTKGLAIRLNGLCKLEVCEATHGEVVRNGVVYIAQGGRHMTLSQRNGEVHISISEELVLNTFADQKSFSHYMPSVDALMVSASEVYGKNTIGAILTGMGEDGVVGIKNIKKKGGWCIAQDKSTSLIYGMPQAARASGFIDEVQPISSLMECIMEKLEKESYILQDDYKKERIA